MQFKYLLPVRPQLLWQAMNIKPTVVNDDERVLALGKNALWGLAVMFLPIVVIIVIATVQGHTDISVSKDDFSAPTTNDALAGLAGVVWMYWIFSIMARLALEMKLLKETVSAQIVIDGLNPYATKTDEK